MSAPNVKLVELIDVAPLGSGIADSKTRTLLSTPQMKVVRLVLPAGKQIASHKAPGEITVQCIEGEIAFTALGETKKLCSGQLLHLPAEAPHALEALADASILVTIAMP